MRILLVEDDEATRKGVEVFLKSLAHDVVCADNGRQGLQLCQQSPFDLVLSDVKMPELSGLELLSQLRAQACQTPVMIMTAFANFEDAVAAMKSGAEDYLTKPLNLDELSFKIGRIETTLSLLKENRQLKDRLGNLEFPEMIGVSKALKEIQRAITQLSNDPDVSVMIYGESGTGKELVARTIHSHSQRAQQPFVDINCAALVEELLESELFGYKKGAFTGAYRDKAGIFQSAHRGTLFLDEVGEMSPRMQTKLLRALQEHVIQPVGGNERISVDVRIIGAANQDLYQLVQLSKFRKDLYYRLNVVEIHLPALREHREDVPLLLQHFVQRNSSNRTKPLSFSREAFDSLEKYDWPGNVRELENLVRMLIVTCDSGEVKLADLPEKVFKPTVSADSAWESLWQNSDYRAALNRTICRFEKEFLRYQLQKNLGNISKTAVAIGLSRVALHKKIKQYGIEFTPEQ